MTPEATVTMIAPGSVEVYPDCTTQLPEIGPLETDPPARPACFGATAVADEYQFRVEVEPESGQGAVVATAGKGPDSYVETGRSHQRVDWVDQFSGHRVDPDGCAACVVGMETGTGVEGQLGGSPWPPYQTELWVEHPVIGGTGVGLAICLHLRPIVVSPKAEVESKLGRKNNPTLAPQATTELAHIVLACGKCTDQVGGAVEPIGNRVVTQVEPHRAFGVSRAEVSAPSVIETYTDNPAIVDLLEPID